MPHGFSRRSRVVRELRRDRAGLAHGHRKEAAAVGLRPHAHADVAEAFARSSTRSAENRRVALDEPQSDDALDRRRRAQLPVFLPSPPRGSRSSQASGQASMQPQPRDGDAAMHSPVGSPGVHGPPATSGPRASSSAQPDPAADTREDPAPDDDDDLTAEAPRVDAEADTETTSESRKRSAARTPPSNKPCSPAK